MSITKDLELIKQQHLIARKQATEKYPLRLAKVQDSIQKEKWDLVIHIKNKSKNKAKFDAKIATLNFKAPQVYNRKFLFLDCSTNADTSGYQTLNYTLKNLLQLKAEKNRTFKKLIKNYQVITVNTKAGLVLKSLSKLLVKNGKTPNIVDEQKINQPNNNYLDQLANKTNLNIKSEVITKKIGSLSQDLSTIESRIESVLTYLKTQDYVVKKVQLKSTRSPLKTINL